MHHPITLVLVAALSLAGIAPTPQPADPPRNAPHVMAVAADRGEPLRMLSFLAGTWLGEHEGDTIEELWSEPRGDGIVGVFRWQAGGKTTMQEILSITKSEDFPVLRLRHFSGDLEPWRSEADGIPAMKATSLETGRVVFTNDSAVGGLASIEYRLEDDGKALVVVVSFKDAGRSPLNLRMARSGATPAK